MGVRCNAISNPYRTSHFYRAYLASDMALRGQRMMCAWCGSKGGFANRLIISLTSWDEAIYECEWCSLKIDVELMKEVKE
jgi:hypothetical protein